MLHSDFLSRVFEFGPSSLRPDDQDPINQEAIRINIELVVRLASVPGQQGNVAIAGHRDTYFRALRNVRNESAAENLRAQPRLGDVAHILRKVIFL